MNVNQVELETVCGITSILPENLMEEFAFAGKSNVNFDEINGNFLERYEKYLLDVEKNSPNTIWGTITKFFTKFFF